MDEKNIGTIDCFVCKGEAKVRQTKARGNHFYLSCPNCGTLQGQKPVMQQRIWNEATFFESSKVRRPSNVKESSEKTELEPKSEPVNPQNSPENDPVDTKVQPDFNPNDEPNEPEGQPEQGGTNKGLVAAFVVGTAALVGAFL